MRFIRALFLIFFTLFAIGGTGFLAFTFYEHYMDLQSKLRWAKRQHEILQNGLEATARERKELEKAQLDFSTRVADLENRLKAVQEERQSLFAAIRRITVRNRELAQKEEAAEAARSEVANLRRRIIELERKHEAVLASSQQLEKEYLKAEEQLLQNRESFRQSISQTKTRLEEEYEAKIRTLNEKLAGLQKQMEEDAPLLGSREALEKEVKTLQAKIAEERIVYFYNLGVAYTRVGMFREAAKMYEKALEINPNDAQVHHNLGILYQAHLAEREKAVKHFQRFVALTGDEKERNKVLRWIDEIHHSIGHPRRTVVESSRDAFDHLLHTTA